MAVDPICGMTVAEASTLRAEREGRRSTFAATTADRGFCQPPLTAKHEEQPSDKVIYTCPMHQRSSRTIPRLPQVRHDACVENSDGESGSNGKSELHDMVRRFWIGAALALPVFVLAMAHLIPALGRQPWANGDGSRWLQFALTAPVVCWAGWPFFKRGWRSVVTFI